MKRTMVFLLMACILSNVCFKSCADTTTRIGLKELMAGVANPDIIINENSWRLDAMIFPMLAAYPAEVTPEANNPQPGSLYIVPATPTGDWFYHANDLAVYNDGWKFIEPQTGYFVYKPGSLISTFSQTRIVWTGLQWLEMNKLRLENIYLGGSGASLYVNLSIDYDPSRPFSSFGPLLIREATTGDFLLYIDPYSRRLTSDWPINSASGYQIDSVPGFTGVIPSTSNLVVSGGIIIGVTD